MNLILDDIDKKGNYYVAKDVTASIPRFSPKLHIEGMDSGEQITFPLQNHQAQRIRSLSEKAPFGSGLKTVLDESIRKAWQIDASKISFGDTPESTQWQSVLNKITMDCVASLGLTEYQRSSVQANLHKMLLYEPGGHFQKHRDTEKEPGMFGTMILQLPAKFKGGALMISHKDETNKIDFSKDSDACFYATAFYADCEHELLPVVEGWRLCLAYNLVLRPKSTSTEVDVPTALTFASQTQEIRRLARRWDNDLDGKNAVGHLLEHSYTETNLHFSNLKGRDKEIVDFLSDARDKDGNPLFVVCLMLAEKHEYGEPEVEYGRSSYNRYDSDDGDHAMGEVHETETDISHWIGPDDRVISNFNPQFSLEDDLLTDEDVDNMFGTDPSKEEYEGYTGNAGPTLEYWYYRGIVVFWPRGPINMRVVKTCGVPYMLSYISVAHSSEVSEISEELSELVEKGKVKLSAAILEGLLQAKDERLITKALKSCKQLPDESFAKVLAKVIDIMKSDEISNQALETVKMSLLPSKPFSQNHYYYSVVSNPLSLSLTFLESLKQRNLFSTLKVAREIVVSRAVQNFESAVKSTKLTTLAQIAFVAGGNVFQSFHKKVLSMGESFEKLKSILEGLLNLGEDAIKHPLVISMAKLRYKKLLRDTANGVPKFSWRQSKAIFSGSHSAEVTSFLRSDEKSCTIHSFNGISHARNWAGKYFGYYGVKSGYSATAIPGGRGQSAYVTLTKTNGIHEEMKTIYLSKMREMSGLKERFGDALDISSSVHNKRNQASPSSDAPSAKKPRDKEIIVIDC